MVFYWFWNSLKVPWFVKPKRVFEAELLFKRNFDEGEKNQDAVIITKCYKTMMRPIEKKHTQGQGQGHLFLTGSLLGQIDIGDHPGNFSHTKLM